MTDRELLALMSATILGSALSRGKAEPVAEQIVNAAEELLDEVDERVDKKGRLLPEETA